MVIIPGTEGVFGVLKGHAKLTSDVDVGVIRVISDGFEAKYFVHGGVAQVTGDELNIVSDFAASLTSESKNKITNNISNLKAELAACEKESVEADIISDKLEKYQAMLEFV